MKKILKEKKHIFYILIFLIIILICLFFIFKQDKPKKESTILEFLNYDVPYDGEVKLANYKKYVLDINEVFNNRWENFLEDTKENYKVANKLSKEGTIKNDSIVDISYTFKNDKDEILFKMDTIQFDFNSTYLGVIFSNKIKESLVGKKIGDSIKFTIDSKDVLYIGDSFEGTLNVEVFANGIYDGYIYPELNDEFFLNTFGITKEEYKNDFYNGLSNEVYSNIENYNYYIQLFIGEKLYEDCTIIKESTGATNAYMETAREFISQTAARQKLSIIELATQQNMTVEELELDYSKRISGYDTILIEIALKEGIDISDKAFKEYLLKWANIAGFETLEDLYNGDIYKYNEAVNKQEFVEDQVLNYLKETYVEIIQWDGLNDEIKDIEEYLKEEQRLAIEKSKEDASLNNAMNQIPVLDLDSININSN